MLRNPGRKRKPSSMEEMEPESTCGKKIRHCSGAFRKTTLLPVITKLSTKGQVVIPQALRERKNLQVGDILEIEETAQGIFLRKRSKVRPQVVEKSGMPVFHADKGAPVITSAMVQKIGNEIL